MTMRKIKLVLFAFLVLAAGLFLRYAAFPGIKSRELNTRMAAANPVYAAAKQHAQTKKLQRMKPVKGNSRVRAVVAAMIGNGETISPKTDWDDAKLLDSQTSYVPSMVKGGVEEYLCEWLFQPETGYPVHLEERYGVNEKGVLSLLSVREYVADHVMLTLDAGVDFQAFCKEMSVRGMKVQTTLVELDKGVRIVLVKAPKVAFDSVTRLQETIRHYGAQLHPDLDSIVRATSYIPNDPYFNSLWGMKKIEAPEAWELGTSATNVVVAVLDTGVNYFHEDLTDNIYRDLEHLQFPWVRGVRIIEGVYSPDPFDDNGHGSHCAGTIAASGNNGKGVVGAAWNARIMPIKVLSKKGTGYDSDVLLGLNYARTNGADIVSCSFGGFGRNGSTETIIGRMRIRGITLACAAGNGGEDGYGDDNDKYPQYPSSYDLENIVAVSSSGKSDTLSKFSNFGYHSVDVAAPGEEILSTTPIWVDILGGTHFFASTDDQDSNCEFLSGTSMATPHVAGALTLLRGRYPDDDYRQTIQRLFLNGDDVESLHGKIATGKRINLYKAMLSVIPPAPIPTGTMGTYEDRVEVTWKPVGGAQYYKVWRRWSEDPDEEMVVIQDWSEACKATDRTAELKTGYHYYVKCSKTPNEDNSSPMSLAAVGYRMVPVEDEWDPIDNLPLGATTITPVAELQNHGQHTLNPKDSEDWFKIAVKANQTYVFESSGTSDLYAELYSSASTNTSEMVAYDDDSGTNGNFRLVYSSPSDGTVFLRVRRWNDGETVFYQLRHQIEGWTDEWDPEDDTMAGATDLTPSFDVQSHGLHQLSINDPHDVFSVQLIEGHTYVFTTTGDTDTFAELFKDSLAAGNTVAWNDDGFDSRTGNNLNFRLVYTATTSGTYYLRVKLAPSGGSVGTYTLQYHEEREVSNFVFADAYLCEYVKNWSDNGFFTTNEVSTVGLEVIPTGSDIFMKWALSEATYSNVGSSITNLVELLDVNGQRIAWGHAVVENGLSEDEFYDFITEIPALPAGAYSVRLTLNQDINGNASVNEAVVVDNAMTKAFTVVASGSTVTKLDISGNATVPAKQTASYVCTATYGDDRTLTIAPQWSISEGGELATVQADGVLTTTGVNTNSEVTLRAVFGGQIATKAITIIPGDPIAETHFPDPIYQVSQPMTVTAEVYINGIAAVPGDEIAAFAGTEVRGVTKVDANGRSQLAISVAYPGETITFKVFDASEGDEGTALACAETVYGLPGQDGGEITLTAATDDPFGLPESYGDSQTSGRRARIYASVKVNGYFSGVGDMVAVFAGDRLVGKASVTLLSSIIGLFTGASGCTIDVNISAEEDLTFMVWDRTRHKLCASTTRLHLAPGETKGSSLNRFLIEANDRSRLTLRFEKGGWHLVSINVAPSDPTVQSIFTGTDGVNAVKSEDQEMTPEEAVEVGKGYWVETCQDDVEVSIEGSPDEECEIALKAGWNLVGYPLPRQGRVEDVLRTALSAGLITEIISGASSYPRGNLTMLCPGQAYWMNASSVGTLKFDKTGMLSSASVSILHGSDFGPFGNEDDLVRTPVTPIRYQDVRVLIGNVAAAPGDCLAVYDEDNVLRAMASVNSTDGRVAFPVYAPESTRLYAKVWNAVSGLDSPAIYRAEGTFVLPASGSLVTNMEIRVKLSLPSSDPSTGTDHATTNAPASFKVTFDLGTHGSRSGGGELVQSVPFGSSALAPTIACAAGWAFHHWNQPFANVRSDLAIQAVYKKEETTGSSGGNVPTVTPSPIRREAKLTFDANGGSGRMSDQTFNYDNSKEHLEKNEYLREGYTFLGWSTSVSGSPIISDVSGVADVAHAVGITTNDTPVTLYAQWGSNGFEFDTRTIVANAGTRVRVPVSINTSRPLACVNVRLSYDANILILAGVERGDGASVFNDDFLVTRPNPNVVAIGCFSSTNVVVGASVLATALFDVREGTEGLFSDVTIVDVQLTDESGVRDVTDEHPITTACGMVRVMSREAMVARLENAQMVAPETTLATLNVMAGDSLSASTNRLPVMVTTGVTSDSATRMVPIRAPHGGWQGGRYHLLRTPTTGLDLRLENVAPNVAYAVTEERSNEMSTYLVDFSTPGMYTSFDEEFGNLKISRDFLLQLSVDNPSPNAVSSALKQSGRNGLTRLQNYVLGLDGNDAASKIVLRAPRTADRSKIRLHAPEVTPVKDVGLKPLFRLQKSEDGGNVWINVGDVSEQPSFDLDVTSDPTGLYRIKTVFEAQK